MRVPAVFAEFLRCSLVVVLAPRLRHALNFGKTHSTILPVSFLHWYENVTRKRGVAGMEERAAGRCFSEAECWACRGILWVG